MCVGRSAFLQQSAKNRRQGHFHWEAFVAGRILGKEELAIDRCINGLKFLSIELSTKSHEEDP